MRKTVRTNRKPSISQKATSNLKPKLEQAEPAISSGVYQTLHRWNKRLAIIYAVQGIAILVLGVTKTLPVTSSFLSLNHLASETAHAPMLVTATRHLFDINICLLVVAFLFVLALGHGLSATVYRAQYEASLRQGINYIRWITYGLGGALMWGAIALLAGVTDLSLLTVIGINSLAVGAVGWGAELQRSRQGLASISCLLCWIGYAASAVSCAVLGFYLLGALMWGEGTVPAFVYWLYVTVLLVAISVVVMHRRRKILVFDRSVDHASTERIYMLFGLVAATLLVWQIFAGALRP